MSAIQNSEARRLLSVLSKIDLTTTTLNYGLAAEHLGRPKDHVRAVATICNLLDAAAVVAKVPLLALWAVRDAKGNVNRKAWADVPEELRDRIIDRSRHHTFGREDFEKIGRALDDLGGLSNYAAWQRIKNGRSPIEIAEEIADGATLIELDAINDIGTDAPSRSEYKGMRYARNSMVRRAVLRRAAGKCEFCNKDGFICEDGSRYLECHHIIALADDGEDRMTNVIALCPDDHRKAHFGQNRKQIEENMISIVRSRK